MFSLLRTCCPLTLTTLPSSGAVKINFYHWAIFCDNLRPIQGFSALALLTFQSDESLFEEEGEGSCPAHTGHLALSLASATTPQKYRTIQFSQLRMSQDENHWPRRGWPRKFWSQIFSKFTSSQWLSSTCGNFPCLVSFHLEYPSFLLSVCPLTLSLPWISPSHMAQHFCPSLSSTWSLDRLHRQSSTPGWMPSVNQSLSAVLAGPPCLLQQCLLKHFPYPLFTLSQVNFTVSFIERIVVGFPWAVYHQDSSMSTSTASLAPSGMEEAAQLWSGATISTWIFACQWKGTLIYWLSVHLAFCSVNLCSSTFTHNQAFEIPICFKSDPYPYYPVASFW